MSLSLIANTAGAFGVLAADHHRSHRSSYHIPLSHRASRLDSHVAHARKGLSRTRRLENRDKNDGDGISMSNDAAVADEKVDGEAIAYPEGFELSTTPMPVLPGEEEDFWEGPQWEGLGFFVQYQWVFGIFFALIACGIAAVTYNDGATDFRQTTIYKESVQSEELLNEPETSDADVFEANPTEVAPSLE